MTFARKIFIAVFLSTLIVGTSLIWAAHKYVESRAESEFVERYKTFASILADTLTRLDTNTESLMMNAAQVVAAKDKEKGLLSTDELRSLQSKLGITHLFVIDKTGRFLRSTNDDPATIPNLFSFSPRYRKLLTGELEVEATPVIKPNPEPKPFKFLSIANHDRTRIIEVGVRLDFIANMLVEAAAADKSVLSMSMYAPDGTTFGTFAPNNVVFESQKAELPATLSKPIESADEVKFYTKVKSSHPDCGQCEVSGTSINGEYYYVLESRISKVQLNAIQTKASYIFLLVGLGNLLLSWLLARFLARRLVRNIETAVARVKTMKSGGLKGRINLDADDEVSFLTKEFDNLLESLEESQRKLIESELVRSKIELSKVVAHNIRSPILAIEMMLPTMVTVSDKTKRILRNSVSEIKQLVEKLNANADVSIEPTHLDSELVSIPVFLQDFVTQKRMEFSSRPNLRITLDCSEIDLRAMVRVSTCELSSVLSNILNNSAEAIQERKGIIALSTTADAKSCLIRIRDTGSGMASELVANLGKSPVSTKGPHRGIGLTHAFKSVRSWSGHIEIHSEQNSGTTVLIQLPRYAEKLPKDRQVLRVAPKHEAQAASS